MSSQGGLGLRLVHPDWSIMSYCEFGGDGLNMDPPLCQSKIVTDEGVIELTDWMIAWMIAQTFRSPIGERMCARTNLEPRPSRKDAAHQSRSSRLDYLLNVLDLEPYFPPSESSQRKVIDM